MTVDTVLESLFRSRPDRWSLDGAGVTRSESVIPALVDRDAQVSTDRLRVLLVGGLSGKPRDAEAALQVLEHSAVQGETNQRLAVQSCKKAHGRRRRFTHGHPFVAQLEL